MTASLCQFILLSFIYLSPRNEAVTESYHSGLDRKLSKNSTSLFIIRKVGGFFVIFFFVIGFLFVFLISVIYKLCTCIIPLHPWLESKPMYTDYDFSIDVIK